MIYYNLLQPPFKKRWDQKTTFLKKVGPKTTKLKPK